LKYLNHILIREWKPARDFKTAFQLWQQGITHTEVFLQQGETAAGVREQVLKLYGNAGITQGQPLLAEIIVLTQLIQSELALEAKLTKLPVRFYLVFKTSSEFPPRSVG